MLLQPQTRWQTGAPNALLPLFDKMHLKEEDKKNFNNKSNFKYTSLDLSLSRTVHDSTAWGQNWKLYLGRKQELVCNTNLRQFTDSFQLKHKFSILQTCPWRTTGLVDCTSTSIPKLRISLHWPFIADSIIPKQANELNQRTRFCIIPLSFPRWLLWYISFLEQTFSRRSFSRWTFTFRLAWRVATYNNRPFGGHICLEIH